jgi:hypothetical protein
MKKRKTTLIAVLLLGLPLSIYAQVAENISLKPENLVSYGVSVNQVKYKGKDALEVVQSKDTDFVYTYARLKDIDFHNGTIEAYIAGEPRKGATEGARGFVGISFRVSADTTKFETFYIRPTNGRASDQERRNHSLQYISYPGYHWQRLRKETPERYESYTDLIPGEWTKIKIEVNGQTARLYVNGAEQPNLIVNDLKQGKDLRGSIALWIAIGTHAHFANLKITKAD